MLRMTTRQNHPNGLKRWNGKFSTMLKDSSKKKILKPHCFPLHDHFGEFLVGFATSTKS
jgi:hypothetical protein